MMMRWIAMMLCVLWAAQGLADDSTDDKIRYNLVELQADAQADVPNDTMTATMFVEQSGHDPAQLADSVNKTINEALRLAAQYKQVKSRSSRYQTYPVYGNKGRLEGWRVRSEIILESSQFEAMAALIGKLQPSTQLGGMNFFVSPLSRRKIENDLITQSIALFRDRAEIVRGAIGGKGYKIVRMRINTGEVRPVQPFAMKAMSAAEVAAPRVEAGTSQVSVTVSGAVEIE